MQGAYRLRWVSDVALIERAEELLAAQGEGVAALFPEGAQPFDAHTHLGLDEDGHELSVAQHLRLMDEAGVSAANVCAAAHRATASRGSCASSVLPRAVQ